MYKLSVYIYVYLFIYIHIYVYVYIYEEVWEREVGFSCTRNKQVNICIQFVCIYIYVIDI